MAGHGLRCALTLLAIGTWTACLAPVRGSAESHDHLVLEDLGVPQPEQQPGTIPVVHVDIIFVTDAWGGETGWTMTDPCTGEVLGSADYDEYANNQCYVITGEVPVGTIFTIMDSFGDGLWGDRPLEILVDGVEYHGHDGDFGLAHCISLCPHDPTGSTTGNCVACHQQQTCETIPEFGTGSGDALLTASTNADCTVLPIEDVHFRPPILDQPLEDLTESPTTSAPTPSPTQSPTTPSPTQSPTTSTPTPSPTQSPTSSPSWSPTTRGSTFTHTFTVVEPQDCTPIDAKAKKAKCPKDSKHGNIAEAVADAFGATVQMTVDSFFDIEVSSVQSDGQWKHTILLVHGADTNPDHVLLAAAAGQFEATSPHVVTYCGCSVTVHVEASSSAFDPSTTEDKVLDVPEGAENGKGKGGDGKGKGSDGGKKGAKGGRHGRSTRRV